MAPAPGTRGSRAGMVAFWAASMAVGAAAFVVLAVVAHAGRPGALAASSAVLSLSFVLAVVPGAIQLRATAEVAAGRRAAMPRGFVATTTGLLAAAAVPASAVLAIPVASLLLLAAQYGVASVASAQRGLFLGAGDHAAASRSMLAETVVRIGAGVALAGPLGATGVAAALLLGSVGATLVSWRSARGLHGAPWRTVIEPAVAVGMLMLLVNLDGLLVPRLLDQSAADVYAAAALPVRGIFFALFTISWLVVPGAVQATRRSELLAPVGLVLGLGAAAGLTLLGVRPLLPIALGDPAPAAPLLALLAAATAFAAALAAVLAMSVARGVRRPWGAPAVAATVLLVALLMARPTAEGVAVLVLVAVAAALLASLGRLLHVPRLQPAAAPGVPLLARR